MNILPMAVRAMASLIPPVSVELININTELVLGIAECTESRIKAIAHVQPVTPVELRKIGEFLDTSTACKFFIVGNNAEIVNSFIAGDIKNTKISYNNNLYEIYSKTDWSQNGWIKLIGVLNASS